jgi:Icc-related predicted phosphoesterase
MKILAIADRNPGIDIAQTVADEHIDLIVTLGDLERHDLLGLLQAPTTPKIGVYGNHDSGNYMTELGIIDLHRKAGTFQNTSFGGLQGCVRYKDNPDAIMSTQEETWQLLKDFPYVDVFITHCPPRGVNDEEELAHQGFDALRDYVQKIKPKYLLHGHTYPTEETVVKTFGETEIVYVHKYNILTI